MADPVWSPSIQGVFDPKDFAKVSKKIADHLFEFQTNEDTPTDLTYTHPRAAKIRGVPLFGSKGGASPSGETLVVLDVGRWGGGGTGASDNKKWSVQRDFGVVYGRHVCLCSFANVVAANASNPNVSKSTAWTDVRSDVKTKCKELENLFLSLDKAGMGDVIVRRHVVAEGKGYDPKHVYVFTGDMHLGVVRDGVPSDARIPGNVRMGRCTINVLEQSMGQLIAKDDKLAQVAPLLRDMWKTLGTKGAAITGGVVGAGPLLAYLTAKLGGNLGTILAAITTSYGDVANDTMSDAEEQAWYDYYVGTAGGSLPADIFQKAGADFAKFATQLIAANASIGNCTFVDNGKQVTAPIQVQYVQMGDMFDLWVGFSCYYQAAPPKDNSGTVTPGFGKDPPFGPTEVVTKNDPGLKMPAYWGKRIMTVQKDVNAALHTLFSSKDAPPVFLYGNHDNYYGAIKNGSLAEGTFARQGSYNNHQGIYGEHGHQWPNPNSNSDDAPLMGWVQALVGTPSPFGNFVTQAAFVRPAAARNLEGAGIGCMSLAESEQYGQRFQQIGAACDKYLALGGGYGIYVLAHTHVGSLARVRIVPPKVSPAKIAETWEAQDVGKLEIEVQGDNGWNPAIMMIAEGNTENVYTQKGGGIGNIDVKVTWSNIIEQNGAWVALVDSTSGAFARDFWVNVDDTSNAGRKADSPGGSGSHTFKNVRPGEYEVWLFGYAATHRPSLKSEIFGIAGVSAVAHEPAPSAGGERFFFLENDADARQKSPIILRWAGMPLPMTNSLTAAYQKITGARVKYTGPWAGLTTSGKYVRGSQRWEYLTTDGRGTSSGRKAFSGDRDPGPVSVEKIVVYLKDGDGESDWGPIWASCPCALGPVQLVQDPDPDPNQ